MNRIKRVGLKLRKEQEEEIKGFFKEKRMKIEPALLPKVELVKDLEEEILALKEELKILDSSDSSSCASNADARDREYE